MERTDDKMPSAEKSFTEKPADKKQKTEKRYPLKKLPKLYRAQYTDKQFEKKLLKKFYIADDKTFVEGFFVTDAASGKHVIPQETTVTKKELARLKRIAKEIRRQKLAVKFVPLLAVVCLFASIGLGVTLFKNVFLKRAITGAMQNIFKAKTDIARVDLRILKASLEIDGLQQADYHNPMKNLYEIGQTRIKFNLNELLKGKVHIEDVTVAGIAWNTDRTVSGELPQRKKSSRSAANFAMDKATAAASAVKQKLQDAFAEYDPAKIISNLEGNFQSLALSQEIQPQVESRIERWKVVPDEVRGSVSNFAAMAQESFINIDWRNISDVQTLTNALTAAGTMLEQGKKLQTQFETIMQDIQTDAAAVQLYAEKIAEAVAADRAYADRQIAKLSELKTTGIQGIMNDMISAVIYSLSGKYYPYVKLVMDKALEARARSGAAAPKKKSAKRKKFAAARLKGQDIFYKKDIVPKFLLENMYTSGTGFAVRLQDVSSDMDLWGKPAVFDGNLNIAEHENTLAVTVDARSKATNLIAADYAGINYAVGVSLPAFGIDSTSEISARATGAVDGTFAVGGTLDMQSLKFTTEKFEPEFVCDLYERALAKITRLRVGFTFEYTDDESVSLALDTDADTQLIAALTELFKEEMSSLIAAAKERLYAELEGYTKDTADKIAEFTGIQTDLRNLDTTVNNIQSRLNAIQDEIQAQIKKQATEAANAAINEAAGKALENISGGAAGESVNDAIRGLFGR